MLPAYLGAAALLWLLFVAAVAFDQFPGALRGAGVLLILFAWHAAIGFLVARAFPAKRGERPDDAFEVARTTLLATAVSLALGFGAGVLLQGFL